MGYSIAGFKELLAVEWEDHAASSFALNFPHVPLFHGDIAKLSVEECRRLAGLTSERELDVFDGSPPCQGFSTIGRRSINDPRNSLFKQYIRLVRGLMPKIIVMENVSGMVKGKMRLIFVEILRELEASGYRVKAQLMSAASYGVPQRRERVIFIGVRNDLKLEPIFPKVIKETITVETALFGAEKMEVPKLEDGYGKLWPLIAPGKNAASVLNGKGFNGCAKIDPSRPAPTLPKMQSGKGFATIVHYKEPRALSIAEAKRLQSFPDEFKLQGTYQEQWARIGNSVCPLFMAQIAKTIKSEILDKLG